ncbi:MAG: AtpZ/AtpI family protein [Eubacteriales bacterium]|nr:AtpZ/AtpI family protein [Eubacteriales bacterium]
MKNDGKALRNIVLISQLAICVMVPTFICLALGIWLDKRFGTWFTVPLLFIGMAAGARNAYVLAMNTVRQDKAKKDKAEEIEIERKVEEYRKKQEKDSSDIKR